MHWFGEKFSHEVIPDDVFGFPRVAGCPKRTPAFCPYYCSMGEVTEAAKVCGFFYSHFNPPFSGLVTGWLSPGWLLELLRSLSGPFSEAGQAGEKL